MDVKSLLRSEAEAVEVNPGKTEMDQAEYPNPGNREMRRSDLADAWYGHDSQATGYIYHSLFISPKPQSPNENIDNRNKAPFHCDSRPTAGN